MSAAARNLQGRTVLSATVEATITRANGTVEPLGVISRYSAPWYVRATYAVALAGDRVAAAFANAWRFILHAFERF